jgi:hypothetical protein
MGVKNVGSRLYFATAFKARQRQLGLIRSRPKMYGKSNALDYRGNFAHTVASWILIPRGRSFDPHYFGDRRHCGRNQTCHWTRSVGDRTAKELRALLKEYPKLFPLICLG